MTMKTAAAGLMVIAACAADGPDRTPPDQPPGQGTLSALERCVVGGGAVETLWSVNNQHGPVTAIVAGDQIVLGAADGSVKQWAFEADEPTYGSPFATAGAEVGGLVLTSDGHVIAATRTGEVTAWRLADAHPTDSLAIADQALTAVAARPDRSQTVVGSEGGELWVTSRSGGAVTALATELWGVSSIGYRGDALFTAGHWYGEPRIERRDAAAPITVADAWQARRGAGSVSAFDADAATSTLVVAGPSFVAVFDSGDLETGPSALSRAEGHEATGVVILPGGKLFATSGREGALKLWTIATAELVATLPIPSAVGIARDPDGTRLFTSGNDGRLHAHGCR
jgi:WD40 repeat protein